MGTQTRARAMSRPTQTSVQLREKGRSALADMKGVLAQLDEYNGDNEDVLDATSALTKALASMQTTFMLMANSLEEAIAAKEMATSNDQEADILKMLEAASLHDTGDGGDASHARLEEAEGEIAMLRSQLDATEAKLLNQVEGLTRAVEDRDSRIDELENELDGVYTELEEAESVNEQLTGALAGYHTKMAAAGGDSDGKTLSPPAAAVPDISMKEVKAR